MDGVVLLTRPTGRPLVLLPLPAYCPGTLWETGDSPAALLSRCPAPRGWPAAGAQGSHAGRCVSRICPALPAACDERAVPFSAPTTARPPAQVPSCLSHGAGHCHMELGIVTWSWALSHGDSDSGLCVLMGPHFTSEGKISSSAPRADLMLAHRCPSPSGGQGQRWAPLSACWDRPPRQQSRAVL